jgi:hypothetical protein
MKAHHPSNAAFLDRRRTQSAMWPGSDMGGRRSLAGEACRGETLEAHPGNTRHSTVDLRPLSRRESVPGHSRSASVPAPTIVRARTPRIPIEHDAGRNPSRAANRLLPSHDKAPGASLVHSSRAPSLPRF